MHKDDPNTANPSPLEAVPAADFDLVQPPYLVCDARGFLSPWTVCYPALEQQYFNLIASFLPRQNIPTQLPVAQCTPSGRDREHPWGSCLGIATSLLWSCHLSRCSSFHWNSGMLVILPVAFGGMWCCKYPSFTSVCLTGAVLAEEDGPAQGCVWWMPLLAHQKNEVLPYQVEGA